MHSERKPTTFVGIDVGGKELVVELLRNRAEPKRLTLPNTSSGHTTLLRAIKKRAGTARVALEATGTYHLDLALSLAKEERVQLMVVNPLAARRFAQAQMRRAKTDRVDARVLLQFCQSMPFEPWSPPGEVALQLRSVARHMAGLVGSQTALKNQRHAATATTTTPTFIIEDLDDQLGSIAARIGRIQVEARQIADSDPDLKGAIESLISAPGIGERSALLLLGELAILDPDMTPNQIVAHAGLDPRPRQSGTRGNSDGGRKISKVGNPRIRAIMYMVAHNAERKGAVKDFQQRLIARNKPYFVARVAVMRRMLRVAWVLITRKTMWDETLFAPRQATTGAADKAA